MADKAQNRWNDLLINYGYYGVLVGVYLLWKLVDSFVLPTDAVKPVYQQFVSWFTQVYQVGIGGLLSLFGFNVVYYGNDVVMLSPDSGLRVMERCLAVSASFVFFFTVFFYWKKTFVSRLVFGVAGVAIVFLINILRLATYAIMHYKCPKIISVFFHDYGYVVITYGLILLLLIWWIEKTPDKNSQVKENAL